MLGQLVANVAKLAPQHPNDKLIKLLEQGSEILKRQRRSFAGISNDMLLAYVSEKLPAAGGLVSIHIH